MLVFPLVIKIPVKFIIVDNISLLKRKIYTHWILLKFHCQKATIHECVLVSRNHNWPLFQIDFVHLVLVHHKFANKTINTKILLETHIHLAWLPTMYNAQTVHSLKTVSSINNFYNIFHSIFDWIKVSFFFLTTPMWPSTSFNYNCADVAVENCVVHRPSNGWISFLLISLEKVSRI